MAVGDAFDTCGVRSSRQAGSDGGFASFTKRLPSVNATISGFVELTTLKTNLYMQRTSRHTPKHLSASRLPLDMERLFLSRLRRCYCFIPSDPN
ncbi:hypothetical protein FHS27_002279 [Rhodopirellula rubra]|uniref:Uncharacterized protein n=1 Tax=Aporhodopirellula rubra TaxID=980271 RepID=A0A7W5H604_9BACT|nr:hypothetical protein [Aporhodopirellula rubra]